MTPRKSSVICSHPALWRCASLVGLTCALPLLAVAQDATSTSGTTEKDKDSPIVLDTYNVSGGFTGSLAAAAQAKQYSPTIVEVIMSEDIGKLPDISIADSLTRLTGLTTQRTNGRSQGITIRGLVGDFSTGMLNGREQVSTGENRAVEFDQYPADLLNAVVVYKTAAANLTGQGLVGTIDLQTVRPLSRIHRQIAINGYYEWSQLGELTPGAKAKGERFNVSYVDQFDDGKLGIALGFSHSSKPFQGQQFQAWGYPTDSSGNYIIGGTKSYVRSSNLDRDGMMAVIEYKPNEFVHSTIDVYLSGFEEKQLLRGMEIPMAFWSGASLTSGYTVKNGLITDFNLTNVQPVVRNDVFRRRDTPFALGWNLALGEKSEWPVTFDVGYSRVSRNDINLETYSGLGSRGSATNPDSLTVKLIPGQIPVIKTTLDYADGSVLKLSDPQGWGPTSLPGGGMFGYLKYFRAKDELAQFKLSTTHQIDKPWAKSFELGASYSDRFKKDGEDPSGYLNSPSGTSTMTLPGKIGTTDMGFLGLGSIYAYDPLAAYESGVWGFTQNNSTDMAVNTFNVNEKISQAYVQLNFDRKLGTLPFTGNLGIRAIHADQSSKGLSANSGELNAVNGGDQYTQFAPSLNFNFEVADGTFLRLSAARQIARPRMFDMRASQSWSYDATKATSTDLNNSPWSASGGNVKLKPWAANALDLSLEKYFAKNRGYISLAGFYKDLTSYVYTQSVLQDFTGYPVRTGANPTLWQGVSSQPQNGSGGKIKGLEFTLSLPSELISSVKGFGVMLGGAYTDSTIKPWGPTGGDSPIAGLARKVTNVTFYYEHAGFAARLSQRTRSATREYITTFGPPNRAGDSSSGSGYTLARPERVIDAQISYSFSTGAMKDLTLYMQAYNLNNEPLVTYNNGDPRQVMNYQKYGASYSFGAAYKF